MSAPVIEPTRVIELVRTILVMANITAIFAVAGAAVTPIIRWPNAADCNQTRPIRRPAKDAHSVLQVRDSPGFATTHRKQIDLIAWLFRRRRRASRRRFRRPR